MTQTFSFINSEIAAAGGDAMGFGKALVSSKDSKTGQYLQVKRASAYGLSAVYSSFWHTTPIDFPWNTFSGFHMADEVNSSASFWGTLLPSEQNSMNYQIHRPTP